MTKPNKDAPAELAAVVANADQATAAELEPVAQDLTLQEFCSRLSSLDKRVELIGAFHYTETAAGTVKDTEDAFKARFAEFLNKPV